MRGLLSYLVPAKYAWLVFPAGFGYTTPRGDVMSIRELLRSKRAEILDIAARHGARKVRVFGSVARGTARRNSDVDFLVEMDSGRSLLDLIEFNQDLETLLERKVDVLTDEGLSRHLEQRIHAEAVPL